MDYPSVSIAMATYNGEKFLEKQLESLLAQTYKSYDIVICDDKSTDKTVSIIRHYSKKFPTKIKFYSNETNLGYVRNFERAVSLCEGTYVALCDQDDLWDIDKLTTLVCSIGNADMIHTDARLIDQNDKEICDSFTKSAKKRVHANGFLELCVNNSVTGCTAFFRRTLLDKALPFPEMFMHDHWLAIVAKDQGGLKYLDKPLVSYRQHGNNSIGALVSCKDNIENARKREEIYFDRMNRFSYLESYAKQRLSEENVRKIRALKAYYESFFQKKIRFSSAFFYLCNFKTLNSSNNPLRCIYGFFRSLYGRKLKCPITAIGSI